MSLQVRGHAAVYVFLDYLLLSLHLGLITFNLVGWVWRRTRRIHLVVLGLTCLSWFGLGICFGWGYCPLTDWQWQVKRKLGETDIPASCVKYYLDLVSGRDWNPFLVDLSVLVAGLAALGVSVFFNMRDWRRPQGMRGSPPPPSL